MNALPDPGTAQVDASSGASAEPPPRFGGMLRRLVRPWPKEAIWRQGPDALGRSSTRRSESGEGHSFK
jgi:hypothetical protein